MSELIVKAEEVMKRCQIGCHRLDEANDLLAECYGTIGVLITLTQELERNNLILVDRLKRTIKKSNKPKQEMMSSAEQQKHNWIEVSFGSIPFHGIGYGWGDRLANYDRPTWITFVKTTGYTAQVIEEEGKPVSKGINFCIGPKDTILLKTDKP